MDLAAKLAEICTFCDLNFESVSKDFRAEFKENLVFYAPNGNKIYLLGLGVVAGFAETQAAFRSLIFQQKARLSEHVALIFNHQQFSPEQETICAEAALNGTLLGRYDIGLFKTEKNGTHNLFQQNTAKLDIHSDSISQKIIDKVEIIANTQAQILTLMNSPANKVTPQTLGDWAKKSGETNGFSVEVMDLKTITEKGLFALLAVNQGSELEPTFIVMEYLPKTDKKLKKIGLIGKGVTFDTGGISLKDSAGMHYMKSDMGGAAAVLGTMQVAAKLQLPVHLVAAIPATENCVDGKSVKPGDIIGSYLGKTIEVIDTDAEGRLILADGLAYINKNFQPDVLIDLATLTGSVIRTLGYAAAGLFTNNDELARQLTQVGDQCGERLWRLPLWDSYLDDIKSDVADLRNFSGKPTAGAISAAKFLEVFTEKHTAWAHLDIAGTAFGDSEFSSQKSATAYGIRLLTEYLSALE